MLERAESTALPSQTSPDQSTPPSAIPLTQGPTSESSMFDNLFDVPFIQGFFQQPESALERHATDLLAMPVDSDVRVSQAPAPVLLDYRSEVSFETPTQPLASINDADEYFMDLEEEDHHTDVT